MPFQREDKSLQRSPKTPENTSPFAPRPFAIQPQLGIPLTPEQQENEAFEQQKFEATKLQLKQKYSSITPQEQEHLGILQAKMNGLLAQRVEGASQFGHNLAKVAVTSPDSPVSTPIQPKLTIGQPGDKYEQEADLVASQVVSQISQPQPHTLQREEMAEEEQQVQMQPESGIIQREELVEEDLKKEPQLTTDSTQMIQMVRENEFQADPENFLKKNVLSLTMNEGLIARNNNPAITAHYKNFVNKMGSFTKHWFKLIPDKNRSTDEQKAYILTPAIEKYIQEYPEDELLARLGRENGIPAVGGDDEYIQSAFVDYKPGQSSNADTDVGHTTITKNRGTDENAEADFNPDFVFTAAMNGCAFVATPAADDQHFEAWHYQSPETNLPASADFRRDKNPMDWYGAEEYDDGNHPGLFEVTNLLHRDKKNTWNILSQQNETSAQNMNDVSIKKVGKRPFNLEAGNEINIKKKVYNSIIKSKKAKIKEQLDKVNQRSNFFQEKERQSVKALEETVMFLLGKEEEALNNATTIPALHDAGNTIKNNRLTYQKNIKTMIDSLGNHFLERYKEENQQWGWKKNADKISAYNFSAGNLQNINTMFHNIDWIDALISETQP